MEITDALRQRIAEVIQHLDEHTDSPIGHTHVILEVSKQQHQCDMQIQIGSDNFVAKDHADNMYTAIDRVADKIRRQMEKIKSRQKDSRRH